MITRRSASQMLIFAAASSALPSPSWATGKVLRIGLDFSLTGGQAASATRMRDGALLAIEEANAKGLANGYQLEAVVLDDATATAGQADPAQAATNARKFVSDRSYVGVIGPQFSGASKAATPIFSQGGLPAISPSATNPDLTDPKFAAQYRPGGKTVFFRTVTTDAYQGPNMANYFAEVLGVKAVYVLDDQQAYGVGLADAFQKRADIKGIKILGRDQLDPKNSDYSAVLTKIKSLGADGLFFGGAGLAGVKLMKQCFDILPDLKKAGGDGIAAADILQGAGFPACQGWYATVPAPDMLGDAKMQSWITAFRSKYNESPDNFSITSYAAAQVLLQAIAAVASSGKPVSRDLVRDAIQTGKFSTLQGDVAFDENGDIQSKVISVYQIQKNDSGALDDVSQQYKYLGVAPVN